MAAPDFRRLYDADWVANGCIGPVPAGTTTDDTVGTYVTNYIIAAVGLVAAVAVVCNRSSSRTYKILSASFFVWTALGYGLAGVLHQVFQEDELNQIHREWWVASYVATLLGILALDLLVNRLVVARFPSISGCRWPLLVVSLLGSAIMIVSNILEESLLLTGIYSLFILLYSLIVFALWSDWVKVLGVALMMAGMIVQPVLAPRCGDAAYPECFRDCPLPDPITFNHNALFHVLFFLGLGVLGVAMAVNPSTAADKARDAVTEDVNLDAADAQNPDTPQEMLEA